MNKKEAMQAVLDGKKVRKKNWSTKGSIVTYPYWYLNSDSDIVAESGEQVDFNGYSSTKDDWELFEPKQTFYRRKWVIRGVGDKYDTLFYPTSGFLSKKAFDDYWNDCPRKSGEWIEETV